MYNAIFAQALLIMHVCMLFVSGMRALRGTQRGNEATNGERRTALTRLLLVTKCIAGAMGARDGGWRRRETG